MSRQINPLYEFMRADGFITISKILNHAIGINETILFTQLVSSRYIFENRNELTEDGFFFQTIERIEEETALTERQQRLAIKNLLWIDTVKILR